MTRNKIHERADEDLSEYVQEWFDVQADRAIGSAEQYFLEDWIADSIDRVCRGRSADADREDFEERREAAHYGFKPELVRTDPDEEREEYVWETYGNLTPAQVLSVLDDHGYPVNTYGFSSDGKELSRLPG